MNKPKMKIVASFDIPYLQYIDEHYQATQTLPDFADKQTLLYLYQQMALARAIDNKAIKLQRTGNMGTYPSTQGQEAVGVATGSAMQVDDIYCPYYRETGALLQRGVTIDEIFSIWGGDERGNNFQHAKEDLPLSVPIATQCLHAAGIAFAVKYRQQPRVVVTSLGEGGTSKGDFYEAINLAAAWQLPIVFVVNNNQWAISVPRDWQTHAQTIAQKAIAVGMAGIQVDGNDVIALRLVVAEAIERARQGQGPTLIEALTYRLCDHTTADDASRYQPADQVKAAWKKEPIARLGYYLEAQGWWNKDQEATLQQQLKQQIDTAVTRYMKQPKARPEAMFDSLYAQLPDALLDQYDEVRSKA